MFLIYKRIPAATIRREAKSSIKKIAKWFKDNPTRRVCRAQLWYGKTVNIKPKTIAEQVNAAAEEAIGNKNELYDTLEKTKAKPKKKVK